MLLSAEVNKGFTLEEHLQYCFGANTKKNSEDEVKNSIEEIKTVCVKCNKKAIINSKFIINEKGIRSIVYEGEQIDLGGEEKYEPLCWKCWEK